jgi:predicted esterase
MPRDVDWFAYQSSIREALLFRLRERGALSAPAINCQFIHPSLTKAVAMLIARPGCPIVVLAILSALPGSAVAGPAATGLSATARDGQVFLTWQESDTPTGTTFNVYVSDRPIVDLKAACRVGHHVEQHSARDWWEDPASFTKGKTPAKPVGFLLADGKRLDPRGGLFVHTPKPGSDKLYFAVTTADASGKEDSQLVAGANVLSTSVATVPGAIRPIWQAVGMEPSPGAGRDMPLWLNIHAKGGVVPKMEYLVFGDETMGWREGLPFKFSVRVQDGEVVVRPTDRVWIGRPHNEAGDAGTPAIWTFWYGYNSNIYDRQAMAQGTPTNYTEHRNLWILSWVQKHYQTDSQRWYCSGSSMGGCGTVSFGLHHPELFAGLHAHVPIVAYTYVGTRNSAVRLEPSCWTGKIDPSLPANDARSLLDRMNSTRFVQESNDDLPALFLVHGRSDGSIPWENNPSFYRALNDARQAFAVYWDNGTHSTAGKDAPADVKAWLKQFKRYRRDASYPAFSNTSSNRDPGDGRPDNGDIVGWMNRGMDWKDVDDQSDHYAITLLADYPGVEYPVRTDVTLRRLQHFKPAADARLTVCIGDASPVRLKQDVQGRLTIRGVNIPSKSGVRVVIRTE